MSLNPSQDPDLDPQEGRAAFPCRVFKRAESAESADELKLDLVLMDTSAGPADPGPLEKDLISGRDQDLMRA